ncbi:MAG: Ig-like domain-containing protein [Roseburia sp.]|nr:Ig-like domain-containing protein [Roseburia sp.]MCM1277861.1 Ig-like domain-containing protein [Robinsoniella sp.]
MSLFRKQLKKILVMFLAVILITGMLPMQGEAAAVKLNKTKMTIYAGSSKTLKVKGASGKVKWSSNKKSVATVNQNGKVTAKKAGKATITAKVNKKTYQCKVTVKNPYLNSKSLTLSKGKTYQLKITGTSAESWSSNDESVASVSSKGKVTAKNAGKATITCKGKNGKAYKCKVTVEESSSSALTEKQVYADMIAMKSKYPEGMKWTNANYYAWKGGIYSGGYGCAGFAFAISDAAFGDLPARKHTDFSSIRVGDIVRMNNDTHSVIVLEVKENGVVVAEGNYNSSVHWGRQISFSAIRSTGTYVLTRYPQ